MIATRAQKLQWLTDNRHLWERMPRNLFDLQRDPAACIRLEHLCVKARQAGLYSERTIDFDIKTGLFNLIQLHRKKSRGK